MDKMSCWCDKPCRLDDDYEVGKKRWAPSARRGAKKSTTATSSTTITTTKAYFERTEGPCVDVR
jgi:hypothetical protein